MTASALYVGTVRHRRVRVRTNEFRHGIALAYVDLDELPRCSAAGSSTGGPGSCASGATTTSARPACRSPTPCVRSSPSASAPRPTAPCACSRSCARSATASTRCPSTTATTEAERLQALVAEVTNTPWGERHAYVIPAGAGPVLRGGMDKALHVSPFMEMDQRYEVSATDPAETLSVHISSHQDGERAFDATLALRRRELTARTLAEATIRHPASTLRTLVLIYGHALALWLRRVPLRPHPRGR